MYDFALTLCALAAVGLLSVGALALIAPRRLSRSYGAAAADRAAIVYVRATGARDIIIGSIFAVALVRNDWVMLASLCAAGLILSLADLAIAVSFARRFRSEHLAHAGGAVGFAIIIALLLIAHLPH
jgi:hypothetical protein